MKLFVLLILAVFASEKKENGAESGPENENSSILVKIEEDEYVKVNKKSNYIGLTYHKKNSKWRAQRRSKSENKTVYNGYYDDEETAAHASDTLARTLMKNGELNHKINFPGDHTEVYSEEGKSKCIGVTYDKEKSKWKVQRWSKHDRKKISSGYYDDKETAAHASDTLVRKLMGNGEKKLKLNFPDDYTEVYPEEKSSKYIGVSYNKIKSKWCAQRRSNNEYKLFHNGSYDNEGTAAKASDTLARKLMKNGEQKFKLNFPDDHTEVYSEENQKKRKRTKGFSLEYPQNN